MTFFIQPIDLSPGDLLYYGGVEWLNISDFLGKIKKGLELHAMCFVFKTAVVFLCKERLRQKKKSIIVSAHQLQFFIISFKTFQYFRAAQASLPQQRLRLFAIRWVVDVLPHLILTGILYIISLYCK